MAENPDSLDVYLHVAVRGADAVVHREEGSRLRDDGRPQRDGVAARTTRATSCSRTCRAEAYPLAQLRATARSARAPTSRTSTSRGCRPSIASTTSPTTRSLIVAGKFDEAQHAREDRRDVRPHPEADARHRADLHARPGAGRRTHGDAAARRRHADPDRDVSPAGRLVARLRAGDARRADARRSRVPPATRRWSRRTSPPARSAPRDRSPSPATRSSARSSSPTSRSTPARDALVATDRRRAVRSRSPTTSSSARRTSGCAASRRR